MPEIDVERELEVGTVSDFFSRLTVAGIELSQSLKVGDVIRIKGHTTELEFPITSMQINNRDVEAAEAGASVGIKIPERVRRGDTVYKVL